MICLFLCYENGNTVFFQFRKFFGLKAEDWVKFIVIKKEVSNILNNLLACENSVIFVLEIGKADVL